MKEFVLAAKLAARTPSVEVYRLELERELVQNSEETRRYYVARIFAWLFPDHQLDTAPVQIWRRYEDEHLLRDSLRICYFHAIPMMARFVTDLAAHGRTEGMLPPGYIRDFVIADCGEPVPSKTVERLTRNLAKLGFLRRSSSGIGITVPDYDQTSVVLEVCRRFGEQPTTVPFAEIAQDPFWRFIGVPDAGTLRSILYRAFQYGGIAKFVTADELDQVTIARSFTDLLEAQWRLP